MSVDDAQIGFLVPAVCWFARTLQFFSLSRFVRFISPQRRHLFIELYVLLWTCVITLILAFGRSLGLLADVVIIYRLADILSYRIHFVFEKSEERPWTPANIKGSLVTAGLNLYELIAGFAALYLLNDCIGTNGVEGLSGCVDALYFSGATMLTVGYGDLAPISKFGRELVLCQFGSSLIFVLLILPLLITGVAGQVNKSS